MTNNKMKKFVESFKSFYDEPENKFITTDMIEDNAYLLIEQTKNGNAFWSGGDCDDKATVYDNIIEEYDNTNKRFLTG